MNIKRDRLDLERRIRAALAEQAKIITPATLRQPELPRPRRHPAPLVVAIVVVVLLLGGSLGATAFRAPESAQSRAARVPSVPVGEQLPSSSGYVDIEGAHIPILSGWTATELEPLPGARQLCVTDTGDPGQNCASGMLITIGSTVEGYTARVTTAPPDLCLGARQYMSYDSGVTVSDRPAGHYQIWCDTAGLTGDYWQLIDRTLTIATPLSDRPDVYARLVDEIDLGAWAHQP